MCIEVTPQMREEHFNKTGQYASDSEILAAFDAMNAQEENEFSTPVVYEWRFAYRDYDGEIVVSEFYTDIEAAQRLESRTLCQKLEFTKRVRQP